MTMIAGTLLTDRAALAWDSRPETPADDGPYFDDLSSFCGLVEFKDGYAAVGGSLDVGQRAIEILRGSGGGSLAQLGALLARELPAAVAEATTDEYDPSHSQVVLVTAASGELEAGMYKPVTGLQRYPLGACWYIPPHPTALSDPHALSALFDRFAEAVADSPTEVGPAIRSFYRDAARLSPSLSGDPRVAILHSTTGVKVTTGNDAFVKVVSANLNGDLGIVHSVKQRRELGPFHKDTTSRSHTGDTNPTALETITIPANKLGPQGGVRMACSMLATGGGAGTKILLVQFGGATVLVETIPAATGIASFDILLFNDGATNSQFARYTLLEDQGTFFVNTVLLAADTTADKDLVVTVTLGNSGDTFALTMTMVEYIGRN